MTSAVISELSLSVSPGWEPTILAFTISPFSKPLKYGTFVFVSSLTALL